MFRQWRPGTLVGMRTATRYWMIFLLSMGLLLTGAAAAQARPPRDRGWSDCGDGLRCRKVTVPVDWRHPRGATIELTLAQLPATDPSQRRGTLLVNMGGPAAQISTARQMPEVFDDLRRWFDVVLWDPRGFEASAGVTCPDPTPYPPHGAVVFSDQASYDAWAEQNQRFAAGCAQAAGPLAGHLDSWQMAHDMDAIRTVLGERRLTYLGNSYGTVYAQAYLELFPQRVGRMYLDSVADHTTSSYLDWVSGSARVLEAAFDRFASWCATEPSCPLHGRDLAAVWDEVLARASRSPIPAPAAGVSLSAGVIASQGMAVTTPEDWPQIAAALAQAEQGDASGFAAVRPGAPDQQLSQIAKCADYPLRPTSFAETTAVEAALRQQTPHLGWAQAWMLPTVCAGLSPTFAYPQHPIRPRPVRPVLIANGSLDSTTPPEHAARLAQQLPRSRNLAVTGDHALYLFQQNPCVREHVHRYLLSGQLPAPGAACS